ncbi:hypothetical protein BsWGS_04932 [Bradybaena similaris]
MENLTGSHPSATRFFGFKSEHSCLDYLGGLAHRTDGPHCRGVWDTVLCWPAAKVNTVVHLPCPPLPGLLKERKASRHCGPDGLWEGKQAGHFDNSTGFTQFRNCYSKEAWQYYARYISNKTSEEKELLREVIAITRTLEIVGLCVSLVTTIISLFIFCYFRSLKCHRTRIHKNLFVAMLVQISMRVVMYADQLVAKGSGEVHGAASGSSNTIYDTPVVCEALYSLLEYTKTVKFMWMFIEGIYLHKLVAVSVFSGKPNYVIFYVVGWGFPLLITAAWVLSMARMFVDIKCWFAYYMNPIIWIIEAPRAAVMAVNLMFLLNIIRVLVVKLQETQTNEANKVRKAVKAAIVLLPLLGLTNFVIMLEPDGQGAVKFCVWSFFTSFLTASEGFFLSLLYCFLNGEVQTAIRRVLVRHTAFTSRDISARAWRVTAAKEARQAGQVPDTRLVSMFQHRRRSRCVDSICHRSTSSDVPHLPDIVLCRTELMCEDHV